MHSHTHQGQTLRHSHPGGDYEHGYFEHPEDGHPYPATQPTSDDLTLADQFEAILREMLPQELADDLIVGPIEIAEALAAAAYRRGAA